jgi:hypothetical protein
MHDRTLRSLDLSLNGIDYRNALVFEDTFQDNHILNELNVNQNPLGMNGIRCMLRLLGRGTSGLLSFQFQQTAGGADKEPFNLSQPSGPYVLDMSQTYDRARLRMLCKACEHCDTDPKLAFRGLVLAPGRAASNAATSGQGKNAKAPKEAGGGAGKGVSMKGGSWIPMKDAKGIWKTPESGTLRFTFDMEAVVESIAQPEWEMETAASQYLGTFMDRSRLKPSFRNCAFA